MSTSACPGASTPAWSPWPPTPLAASGSSGSPPSSFSSTYSLSDAEALARNLGIRLLTLPIAEPVEAFLGVLKEPFAGTEPGLAEENLQARVRGA